MAPLLPHLLDTSPLFEQVSRLVASAEPGQPVSITGAAGSLASLLISAIQRSSGRQMLILAPTKEQAIRMADDLGVLAPGEPVHLFVGREETEALLTERTRELNDVHTLRSLTSGQASFVVTHAQGVLLRLPSPETVRTEALTLETGTKAGFKETIATLNRFRFDKADIVEKPGEYAVRGGIIDVFPFVGENPVRVEFFEDEVESIREFDVVSQRSIRSLASALFVPDVLAPEEQDAPHGGMLLDYLADGALLVFLDPLLHEEPLQRTTSSAAAATRYHTRERLNELSSLFPQVYMAGSLSSGSAWDAGGR
ncbi:MAG: hypothetical protein IT282_06595, partial [Bacteroidetes bacterium]|nr:hypothetical protein [Bacteroidota bacterium]